MLLAARLELRAHDRPQLLDGVDDELLAVRVGHDAGAARVLVGADAMVAGVLMLMLVYPTGILAASGLDDRLLGLVTGVAAMMLSRRIILSLLCGILMFAASLHLF